MNRRQKLVQKQFLNNEEKVIEQLDDVYGQSLKNVTDKIKQLEFKIGKLQEKYDWLDDDDPQKARIKSQIQSKIYQKQYQQQLQKQLGGILDNLRNNTYLTVSDYLDNCYNDGFIGTIFDLHGQGIPLIMPINQESMVRAVQLDSKISKGLYTRLGEDIADLKKKITAQVSRGISTGMSFEQVAQQIAGNTRIGYNNAIRIARTEGHRIQTTAAMDVMHTAKDKGADVLKQWDATLDGHTRESHAAVDGEIRELDKPFSNGLDFPGDPSGGAAEVINCRCAILQRARWALDEDELETLKERAKYFDLDKTEQFDDFKKKYLKAASSDTVNTPIVNGKDLRDLWTRREDEFDLVIDDIVNAQGFDGLPRVVDEAEFNAAVESSGFVMKRGYHADSEEIVKAYQDELYNGKFYLDCSGGTAYGHGMYSAYYEVGDARGMLITDDIAKTYSRRRRAGIVEEFTVVPNTKFVSYDDMRKIHDEFRHEWGRFGGKRAAYTERVGKNAVSALRLSREESDYLLDRYFDIKVESDTVGWYKSLTDAAKTNIDSLAREKLRPVYEQMEATIDSMRGIDEGELAALLGYDGILVERENYAVILNRSKLIFKRGT